MRLIDADDVMEMLTNIELSYTVIPITEAKLRLRDIPTAYDVDKVVEQLNDRIQILDNKNKICLDAGDIRSADRLAERMHEVIKDREIVKAGGVNET